MRVLLAAVIVASPTVGLAWARPHGRAHADATCAATVVHYTPTRVGLPHADVVGASANLRYYSGATLMDGRVTRSDGLVIYVGGRHGKLTSKILWTVPEAGRVLRIKGRRLDGEGSFVERWRAARKGAFPSLVDVPTVGCWRLSLNSGPTKTSIVLQAIEPPVAQSCDATRVFRRDPPHPRFGAIEWMPATPRSDGVAAVLFVTVFPKSSEAVIPAGGRYPAGYNAKFLWWVPHPGAALTIVGRRLDAPGTFHASFNSASGDVGPSPEIIFPSIIDVPTAGCWALTLRSGRSAGLVVFRVVPAG
jgi:hypothetical protein